MKKLMKLPRYQVVAGIMSLITLSGGLLLTDNAQAAVTWYGPGFYNNNTASGEVYTGKDMTAAHPTLPFGTIVNVNGVDVRINDRCSCELDLSEAAAEAAGVKAGGAVNVPYSVFGASSSVDSEKVVASSAAPAGPTAEASELPKTGGEISYEDALAAGYIDRGEKKH